MVRASYLLSKRTRWLSVLSVIFLLGFIQSALAAQFSATLSKMDTEVGKAVSLQLTLQGAHANGAPSLEGMDASLQVAGRQQSLQVQVVNGNMTQQQVWAITLLPQKEGRFTIPPVTVQTDKGALKSQALQLSVGAATQAGVGTSSAITSNNAQVAGQSPAGKGNAPPALHVQLASPNTYVGQPVLLTITVPGRSISIDTVKADGARVEMAMEPEGHQTAEGEELAVFRYLITPLREGEIIIKPTTVKGMLMQNEQVDIKKLFPHDLANSIEMLEQMMRGGFGIMAPFTLHTPEQRLQAKATPVGWTAPKGQWLPLKNLELSQEIKEGEARVGKPIQRIITMIGTGAYPENLPDLTETMNKMIKGNELQIYPDEPKTEDYFNRGLQTQLSWRQQNFTIVPLQGGELTLPEIVIPWWNVDAERMEYARLPEKRIKIYGSSITGAEIADFAGGKTGEGVASARQYSALWWLIGAGLAGLAIFFGTAYWQRNKKKSSQSLVQATSVVHGFRKEEGLAGVKAAENWSGLYAAVLEWLRQQKIVGEREAISFKSLAWQIAHKGEGYEEIAEALTKLELGAFGKGETNDFEAVKAACLQLPKIRKHVARGFQEKRAAGKMLPPMNP